jgi:hypothetical protein
VLRSLCLFAALALAKAASKASCLFGLGCLFYWKAKKSPNKHPLRVVLPSTWDVHYFSCFLTCSNLLRSDCIFSKTSLKTNFPHAHDVMSNSYEYLDLFYHCLVQTIMGIYAVCTGGVWFQATNCQAKVWQFGMCLVLATLSSIWSTCHRMKSLQLLPHFVAPNFSATLAKLRLGKVWLGTRRALNAYYQCCILCHTSERN